MFVALKFVEADHASSSQPENREEPPQNAEGAGSSNFENARGEETEGQVERRAPAGDEEDKDSPTEVLRC